ncbi:MAG: thermonuclease family protein [Anaerolineae bacterium]
MLKRQTILLLVIVLLLAGCDALQLLPGDAPGEVVAGESAAVLTVIDGDTIDVRLNGERVRVRYIGVNTPERDEPCYEAATNANAELVEGRTVTLVRDVSETDRYGRLLRYVYVGDVFVNEVLVRDGWAEAVVYPPDTRHATAFRQLEDAARSGGLGCHPSGVFGG